MSLFAGGVGVDRPVEGSLLGLWARLGEQSRLGLDEDAAAGQAFELGADVPPRAALHPPAAQGTPWILLRPQVGFSRSIRRNQPSQARSASTTTPRNSSSDHETQYSSGTPSDLRVTIWRTCGTLRCPCATRTGIARVIVRVRRHITIHRRARRKCGLVLRLSASTAVGPWSDVRGDPVRDHRAVQRSSRPAPRSRETRDHWRRPRDQGEA